MTVAITLLALLSVLTIAGALANFTRLPLPILQIAVGAALAWPAGGLHLGIDPELFLLIFIPPLLYADAFNAPKREFKALAVPIISLAFGLVFLTVLVIGYALHWLIPALPLSVAFALAAVLSPTDAVAVTSVIDRDRVPPRLLHVLEGESLLNDASGLVVFRFAVAATITGSFSALETLPTFLVAVAGGIPAGLVTSFGSVQLLRLLRKRDGGSSEAQVVLALLQPFAAYLLAEQFEASGILAAVTAGLSISRARYFRYMSNAARLQNGVTWDTLAFILNGAIFLLLGLQLPAILGAAPPELSTRLPAVEPFLTVLLLTAGLVVLRFAWVNVGIVLRRLLGRLVGRPQPDESLRAKVVTAIAGVRGAVTLAGILSLPLALPDGSPFPARELAIFLAAGVILCSLVVASLLLPALTRNLRLAGDDPIAEEERLARIVGAEAAIARIEALADEAEASGRPMAREMANRLLEGYRRSSASNAGDGDGSEEARAASVLEREMRAAALDAERAAYRKLLIENRINDETLHKLLAESILTETLVTRR